MSVDLPGEIVAFLERPNPAVMAVVRDGSHPVSVPTWYVLRDGRILVNLDSRRKRLRYVEEGSPVSLTVLADGDWYRHVSLQGRVREIVPDPDHHDADLLSRHYIGVPHTPRDGDRVSLWIDVERWHAWRIDGD